MATSSSIASYDRAYSSLGRSSFRGTNRSLRLGSISGSTAGGTLGVGGPSFRHEEDAVIIELGSRYVRAGFEGESLPMCNVRVCPENSRRVGDYRDWIRGNNVRTNRAPRGLKRRSADHWCKGYELWNADVRKFELGLFEDVLERTVHEIYNQYLLVDAGSSRLVLVIPSVVPHQTLAAMLRTLFARWRFATITLLSSPCMSTVAAGLRSALIVDIGWEETTATVVYEYREVAARRSTRAMKMLMHRIALFLSKLDRTGTAAPEAAVKQDEASHDYEEDDISIDFNTCEEVLTKLAWCRPRRPKETTPPTKHPKRDSTASVSPESSPHEVSEATAQAESHPSPLPRPTIDLPLPSRDVNVQFDTIAALVEDTLLCDGRDPKDLDDEEHYLDVLVYETLLSLAPDVRGTCMARIVFTGGGANIPGLKQRILDGVTAFIQDNGWEKVRGKCLRELRSRRKHAPRKEKTKVKDDQDEARGGEQRGQQRHGSEEEEEEEEENATPDEQATNNKPDDDAQPTDIPLNDGNDDNANENGNDNDHDHNLQQHDQRHDHDSNHDNADNADEPSATTTPTAGEPTLEAQPESEPISFIDDKLAQARTTTTTTTTANAAATHGVLHTLGTFGPWAGASLATNLRVKGLVEIEREKFLLHGMAGASYNYLHSHHSHSHHNHHNHHNHHHHHHRHRSNSHGHHHHHRRPGDSPTYTSHRRSFGASGGGGGGSSSGRRTSTSEKSSWTLGAWA